MEKGFSLTGQTLDDKYFIEEELGEGGMGAVYLATHLGTSRPVALKVIHPQLMDNKEFVERFRREAKAAGKLRHPNIVNVTDFGVTQVANGQLAYLVMEYLDGITLKDLIKQTQEQPIGLVLDILEQTALAIDKAHKEGIIHRDLKPANIWLQPNGRGGYNVKVLDFGLAKFTELTPVQPTKENQPKLLLATSGESEAATLIKADSLANTVMANKAQTLAYSHEIKTQNNEETLSLEAISDSTNISTINKNNETLAYNPNTLNSEKTSSYDTTPTDSNNESSQIATLKIVDSSSLKTQIIDSDTNKQKTATNAIDIKEDALTQVGTILGTPHYMSPEQCTGRDINNKTDIYSLGLIAYEMLTGQKAFSGSLYNLMYKHAEEYPIPIHKVRKGIPKSINEVLLWAVAKNRDKRPISANAWILALRSSFETDKNIVEQSRLQYKEYYSTLFFLSLSFYLLLLMGFLIPTVLFEIPSSLSKTVAFSFSIIISNRALVVAFSLFNNKVKENKKSLSFFSLFKNTLSLLPKLIITIIQAPIYSIICLIKTYSLPHHSFYPSVIALENMYGVNALRRSHMLASKIHNIRKMLFLYELSTILTATLIFYITDRELYSVVYDLFDSATLVRSAVFLILVIFCPLFLFLTFSPYNLANSLLYQRAKTILGEALILEIPLTSQETPLWKQRLQNFGSFLFSNLTRQVTLICVVLVGTVLLLLQNPTNTMMSLIAEDKQTELIQLIATLDINKPNYAGEYPLIEAVRYRRSSIIDLFISKGANPNVKSIKGDTPLIKAVIVEDIEIIEKLLKAKADINLTSNKGNTALIWAVRNNNLKIVEFLLKNNADKTIKNSEQKTALDYAKERNDPEILRLLKE